MVSIVATLRVGLPRLSIVERALIAHIRPFLVIVKFTPGPGTAIRPCLKGHTNSFKHEGPTAASHALRRCFPNFDDIGFLFQVVFVGPAGEWERLRNFAYGCSELRVRPHPVYMWLKALRAVNHLYCDIVIDESDVALRELSSVQESIFANAEIITSQSAVAMEQILTDDIAESRCFEVDTDSAPAVVSGSVFVDERVPVNCSKTNASVLDAISSSVDPSIRVRRSELPVNEFADNDTLFCGAFPDKFLRGIGFGSRASLSDEQTMHLLLQHTCTFARDPRFTFLLFDQI